MTRTSDVPCPTCGESLRQPDYESDWPDWDCYNCGLCIPRSVRVDGLAIIEAYRDPELRASVIKMNPDIEFGDKPINPQPVAQPSR